MWLVSVTRSQVWMESRCVKFGVITLTLSYWSLEVQHGTLWQRTLWESEKKNCCSTSAVLNSSPRAPRSAYFACLSLLTHLIQIISLLEVRSMHELCSDWHAPYTGSIAPYSLSREICWSLLYFGTFIHGFALHNVFTHGQVWHHIPL